MNRRQLLCALISTGAFSSINALSAATALRSLTEAQSDGTKELFEKALAANPALIGFTSLRQGLETRALSIEGNLPEDINGHFLRNGPARHERGNLRLQHLFEGDGMVQRFCIGGGKISHKGRFIQTPKFVQEERAGRYLFSGPETLLHNPLPTPTPDTVNTANTNIIGVGDKLWALWEGGSAAQINYDSLEFEQFVDLGEATRFKKSLKGLPFSAHPKQEAGGDIWNFGLLDKGQIVLYHLNKVGSPKNVGVLNAKYHGGMLHDFLITERYVLLILPSIKADSENRRFFSRIIFDGQQAMRVLVVDKNSLTLAREYELNPGFAFHFGNAWEDRDGSIKFDASFYQNSNALQKLGDIMRGETTPMGVSGQTALFTLKASGGTSEVKLKNSNEFPRVNPLSTGKKNRYLYFIGATAQSFWSNTVSKLDIETGQQSDYIYGDDYLVEEHIPINSKNSEQVDYLIGTALHIPTKRTCLNIFDVRELSNGPVCRAWLPYYIPLGFHDNFLQAS